MEVGRNLCHLDIDTVMPGGVAIFLKGRRVYLFPTPRSVPGETLGRYQGNSKTRSGSGSSVVDHLLGGATWYAKLRSARSSVEFLRWTQQLRVISIFVDPPVSVSFPLFFLFLLGRLCVVCPTMILALYRLVVILI